MINLAEIPEKPGIYMFFDLKKIIYIGKAKNLKKRISSYIYKKNNDPKVIFLLKKIKKVEWIITNNEYEALILENNLIKKHKPKFNIKLVDDKTYPYIKIDFKNPFPSLQITRNKNNDKALYFGPYTTVLKLKQVLQFIYKNFSLRKCSEKKFKNRIRPCLNYQINLCPAPCTRKISQKEYKQTLKNVILFLKGKNKKLVNSLTKEMLKYSNELKFEKAAKIRDLIENIKIISNQQTIETSSFFDKDVFYFTYKNNNLYFIVLRIKKGKILDSNFYQFKNFSTFTDSLLEEFILQYYNLNQNIPDQIITSEKCNIKLISDYLSKKFNKKIGIKLHTEKNNLIELAKKNLYEKIEHYENKTNIALKIKNKLKLRKIPNRIDAFDIATFQGKSSVGTRVTFINEKPNKKYYRKYTIKTVKENIVDDYSMIYEVIYRSSKEYIKNNKFPDLILIDGGKGQLNFAIKALEYFKLIGKIDIISIAKDNNSKLDRIYLPNRKNPVNLNSQLDILKYFMSIRDEVHRFSVKYHHKKEEMKNLTSILTQINGIGKKRAILLLKDFKSLDSLKNASFDKLNSLPYLNRTVSKNIINFFKHQ